MSKPIIKVNPLLYYPLLFGHLLSNLKSFQIGVSESKIKLNKDISSFLKLFETDDIIIKNKIFYNPFVYKLFFKLLYENNFSKKTIIHGRDKVSKHKPTIFLFNHINYSDPIFLHGAIKSGNKNILYSPVRNDAHKEVYGALVSKLLVSFLEYFGAVPIKRPYQFKNHDSGLYTPLVKYLEVLNQKHNLLIFPTSRVSAGGLIDYSTDTIATTPEMFARQFDLDIMKYLAKKTNAKFQYGHHLHDIVFDQHHISFSDSFDVREKRLSFLEAMKEFNVFTGLQIYSYLEVNNSEMSLAKAIELVRKNNKVFPENLNSEEIKKYVIDYVKYRRFEKTLTTFGTTFYVGTTKFQANQIKHLEDRLKCLHG